MPGDMSVFHWPLSNGQEVCDYADHARIVAEAVEREKLATRHETMRADRALTALAEMEQAHAAALAAAVAAARAEVVTVELVGDYATGYNAGLIEGDAKGRREGKRLAEAAAAPRTLTAADPEPGVGSVVLDKDGTAGQRVYTDDGVTTIWQFSDDDWCHEWGTVDRVRGPVTLIHDGGAA